MNVVFDLKTPVELGLSANQTILVFKQIFNTPEECNKVKKFVVDKNEENFDRLEDELRKMAEMKIGSVN